MEGIQCGTPACRGATNAVPVQFQGEAARLTCLSVCEDRSADIDIFTAEGDKVTLSSDYHSEATLLTYQHLAFSNSGYEADQGKLMDYTEERNIALSVEGLLNDQEMAEIKALLTDLGEMLKAFLTGEGQGAGGIDETSADLSRYGSLSGFNADFEYKASLQVLSLEAGQLAVSADGSAILPDKMAAALPQTAAAASTGAALPQTAAREAVAAASVPSPVASPAPAAAADAPEPVAAQDEHAAGLMAKRVKDSGLRPRRFMKLLKKFLRGLMQEMRADNAIDGEHAKRGESILEKFFGRLEPSPAGSEIKGTRGSFKQQWVSFQYELKAELETPPKVEETA
jgi:hypothetical protein